MVHPALIEIYSRPPRKPKELWVSEIVFCPRQAYLSYVLNPSLPMKDALLAGIFLHRLIQKKLESDGYGVEVYVEKQLRNDGWKLVGRADVVGDDHIVEIKAVSSLDKDVNDYWIEQANFYAHVLEKPKFKILMVEKPTGRYAEYEYDVDEGLAEKTVDKAKMVVDFIEKKMLPPPCDRGWCRKGYCAFAFICNGLSSEPKDL
jgi:CRISPR/Cas system-associated exonuclease Cas4 (RecB family)